MTDVFLASNLLVFLALILGTITDIRKREVPDMVSYGLMAFGVGYRIIVSALTQSWTPFLEGALGLAVFFALGALMFYTGQWGGGDSKILFGMGAALGIPLELQIPLLGHFLINLIIIGALYGLLWSAILALMNWKAFSKNLQEVTSDSKVRMYRKLVLSCCLLLLLLAFFGPLQGRIPLGMIVVIVLSSFYFFYFIRAVEHTCMYKRRQLNELVEGDWVSEDVIVNKRLFLRKGEIGKKGYDKIQQMVQQNQQTVSVRRSLFGYAFSQTVLPEKLRKGDILLSTLIYFSCAWKKGHCIVEGDLQRLERECLRHQFLSAEIRRKAKTLPFDPLTIQEIDILLDDLYVGEILCGSHDLGLEKEQIALLRKYRIPSVVLKEGIPFIPSFLLAFIVTLWFSGNLLSLLL